MCVSYSGASLTTTPTIPDVPNAHISLFCRLAEAINRNNRASTRIEDLGLERRNNRERMYGVTGMLSLPVKNGKYLFGEADDGQLVAFVTCPVAQGLPSPCSR